MFSIDLRKKYKIKNNTDSYFCNSNHGPDFKWLGYGNPGNLLEKNKCFEYYLKGIYEINEDYKAYEISGNQNILCKDVEVYKVEL